MHEIAVTSDMELVLFAFDGRSISVGCPHVPDDSTATKGSNEVLLGWYPPPSVH
jgi:hypothetical protein